MSVEKRIDYTNDYFTGIKGFLFVRGSYGEQGHLSISPGKRFSISYWGIRTGSTMNDVGIVRRDKNICVK